MNTLPAVSNRLFTAALTENSYGRRRAPRTEKQVIIELARREIAAVRSKQNAAPPRPVAPREVRFDSRLCA